MAIIQKRILSMNERSKEGDHKKVDRKKQSLGFQQHSQGHHRFLPLMSEKFYNCEFCGVGIAAIQIVSGGNSEGQCKACGECLKLYIDEKAVKK
ncbi:MAG: hypothetical protein WBZ36_30215 [Candidatus Nitrosopolaris sp.]